MLIRCIVTGIFLIFALIIFHSPVSAIGQSQILTRQWRLKALRNASEAYQLVDPQILKGNDTLTLTYNLRGLCLLDGDASALVFDQPYGRTWHYISLSRYGKNCLNGVQTVSIPLFHFRGLDPAKPVGTFHIRIWHFKPFAVDIISATISSSVPPNTGTLPSSGNLYYTPRLSPSSTPIRTPSHTMTPAPKPTRTATPTPPAFTFIPYIIPASITPPLSPTLTPLPSSAPTPASSRSSSWSIQSVSSMKVTKDVICSPRSADFIQKWVARAVELGANYIAVETPYENPSCGNAISYTRVWIDAIRNAGLTVWHRHMPLAFEGIYNTTKNPSINFLAIISDYIKTHGDFFAAGDIFTPIPEPQNGGIKNITYCPQNICIFSSAKSFNQWLRDAIDVSESAFSAIGLAGKMRIGYYGFDGFVAWGDNNPNWNGILEDATIVKMGNITIDHYPEAVGDTMQNDLNELEARYPNIPIIIGEWGTITGTNPQDQVRSTMKAATRKSVVGFNYWHMGMGGNESLINNDFSKKSQYASVQQFYKNIQ